MFSLGELEFVKIIDRICKYAKSNSSVAFFNNLKPTNDYDKIKHEYDLLEEFYFLDTKLSYIPLLNDFDILVIIELLTKNAFLNVEEIMQIRLLISMTIDVKNYFNSAKKMNLRIGDLETIGGNIIIHPELLKRIDDIFDSDGKIYDNASLELLRIRSGLKKKNDELEKKINELSIKYSKYLTENIVTIKNNSSVLPVKESYKNQVNGRVVDMSSSKQTYFIEPIEVYEIRQDIESLIVLEKYEIERIMSDLCQMILKHVIDINNNIRIFILLDILQAKTRYAKEIEAIRPSINKEGILYLKGARHPLISAKTVVPIDISMDTNYKTMIITGSNTGGKTVAIKTVGLLTLMMQSSLFIPVASANMMIFNGILASVSNEQSIEQSLSTFSAHLLRLKEILDTVADDCLVLLDEIGSGTDPIEGSALAIAIIDELLKNDIRTLVTTHYPDLKLYAHSRRGIMSASVAFDKDNLKPLYYLELGSSGSSNAFLIAKKLGIKESIIAHAKEIEDGKKSEVSLMLDSLNKEYQEMQIKQRELKEALEINNNIKNDLNKKLIELETVYKKNIEDSLKKTYDKKTEELLAIMSSLNNLSIAEAAKIKNTIKIDEPKIDYQDDSEFKENDMVYLPAYQIDGTVKKIKGDSYYVNVGLYELKVTKKDIRLSVTKTPLKNTKASEEFDKIDRSAKIDIDLRGLRVSEVDVALDRAIDKALLAGFHKLNIIHGFGTMAVKKCVYDYIKKNEKTISIEKEEANSERHHATNRGVTSIVLK